MRNLAFKVRSNPAAFDEYASMINSAEFKEKIVRAANGCQKAAKEVLDAVFPVLSFGGKTTPIGSLGDHTMMSRAMAMAKRYGPGTVFLTLTPDDISNPTSFRYSIRSHNNTSFPACAPNDFFKELEIVVCPFCCKLSSNHLSLPKQSSSISLTHADRK